jgi:chromatin modification-related protein VID21
MTELRLIRTMERVETLKEGRWSFRQPRKQKGVGGLTKTHWDYLLDEMVRVSCHIHYQLRPDSNDL